MSGVDAVQLTAKSAAAATNLKLFLGTLEIAPVVSLEKAVQRSDQQSINGLAQTTYVMMCPDVGIGGFWGVGHIITLTLRQDYRSTSQAILLWVFLLLFLLV
eukprot:6015662-Amphidinium_carterae.1